MITNLSFKTFLKEIKFVAADKQEFEYRGDSN